uniref:WD40 repeat domain-containing protein n=1 Tax=Dictyoglomus thermophilum TaxID=14 RepID=A0A7C3MHB4_DICTH
MKKLISLGIIFLSISAGFSQFIDPYLLKEISLGENSVNYFLIYENFLIYNIKDQLAILDLKNLNENKIRVRSKNARDFNTIIKEFKIIATKTIAVVNNEPYALIYNFEKNTYTELPYNLESNIKINNNFWFSISQNIQNISFSNTGKYILEKKLVETYFLGFIPTENHYEYRILSYPSLKELIFFSTQDDLEESLNFSPKDTFLMLANSYNPMDDKNDDIYGLILIDLKNIKTIPLFKDEKIISYDVSKSDDLLAISFEKITKVIDFKNLSEIFSYPMGGSVRFTEKNEFLIIEGTKVSTLIDIKTKEVINTYLGNNLCISPNEEFLAYTTTNNPFSLIKEIQLVHRKSGTQKKIRLNNEYFLEHMKFSKDEKFFILLLSGKDGYNINIYKIQQ